MPPKKKTPAKAVKTTKKPFVKKTTVKKAPVKKVMATKVAEKKTVKSVVKDNCCGGIEPCCGEKNDCCCVVVFRLVIMTACQVYPNLQS